MRGITGDAEDDIFRPANNERRLKIVQMIKSRPEVDRVIHGVLKNYSILKFDKQVQFYNFLVKAGWKISDSHLQIIADQYKKKINQGLNMQQGPNVLN
jgi:hypothetical protein